MRHFVIAAAMAVAATTTSFASTLTDAFSSFVVLGDSLSDNGNLPTAATDLLPYTVDGKFTNGMVWNEGILKEFEDAMQPFVNTAFGGATTTGGRLNPPSLDEQIAGLAGTIAGGALGGNPLVSIWAGANDIRNAILPTINPNLNDIAVQAANNVAASIDELVAKGINNFLVFNLPDLGSTAEANFLSYGPLASPATAMYNDTLAANLALRDTDDVKIIEVDIATLFAELIADPRAFGVENASDACFFDPADCNPETWLFWDGIHPTAFGHSLIEEQARLAIAAELAPVPLPASAPLLLAGFGLLGWYGRRRQAA